MRMLPCQLVRPGGHPGRELGEEECKTAKDCFQPLHMISLRNTGLLLGEIFSLDALADACADDGRYAFLFTAPPLPITGAVGSPINPLAVK